VRDRAFVEVGQLKLVLSVLVPSFIYVALIAWLGIYVASAIFVAFFMRWLGKYPWWKVAAVSLGKQRGVLPSSSSFWFKVAAAQRRDRAPAGTGTKPWTKSSRCCTASPSR